MRVLSTIAIPLAFLLLPGPVSAQTRLPPNTYPKIYQTMKGHLELSDWARMGQYDIIELGAWAVDVASGQQDSLRALRERHPKLVVLMAWSAAMSCDNWGTPELPGKQAWGDSLDAHSEDWILRDVDGDRFLILEVESNCNQGRVNMTQVEAARQFARYTAGATVLAYPDLLDGIRLDELDGGMYSWNGFPWLPAGVDSIDSNRDGIADTQEELDTWWKVGVDTFLSTLRGLVGDEEIILDNGYLQQEAFHYINGRYHEAFPCEHETWYEKSMTDPSRGYLGGDTLYSKIPVWLPGLLTINSSSCYNLDLDKRSTKDAPFPHRRFDRFLRWTLGSSLMSDGWYAMTGWGTAVDWKGDPVPHRYQTLWWFPIYDTLKTHLGTPTGRAVRDTSADGGDRFIREFTGGSVRVYVDLQTSIFDLRPRPGLDELPAAVRVGDPLPICWQVEDPNGPREPSVVQLFLSRDGGDSFPELLGTFDQKTTFYTWTVEGPTTKDCRFRVTAVDTTDLAGEAISSFFVIAPSEVIAGGVAEVQPTSWMVNAPDQICSVMVSAELADSSVIGWDRALIVVPELSSLVSYDGAEIGGLPLSDSYEIEGNTLRVHLDDPVTVFSPVLFRLRVGVPSCPPSDSLRFSVGLGVSLLDVPPYWVDPGNANGVAGDGDGLSVAADSEDTTGNGAEEEIPPAFALFPGQPNPFQTSTLIRFAMPHGCGSVQLAIYNYAGRHVRWLHDGPAAPGYHTLEWDGRDGKGRKVPPGVYYLHMRTPSGRTTTKLILMQ